MSEQLPLFPLNTVLFPGLVLPLHVFEERYRALVRDLTALPEGQPRTFGVVALREGREVGADGIRAVHDVGCTAQIQEIKPYEDGRADLVTGGVQRFRVVELDLTSRPYAVGLVQPLDEPAGEHAAAAAALVTRAFDAYRDRLGARGRPGDLPADPVVLSYLVAAAMVLDVPEKQRLLEAPTAAERLRGEARLLRREVALLTELPSLPAVNAVRSPYGLS